MRSHLAPLLGLSLLALPTPVLAQVPPPPPERPVIEVVGTGEANARPDIAVTSFTALHSAKTAREAVDATNETMTRVIAAMREAGLADRDLQTSGFSISPQYQYDNDNNPPQSPPVLTGYEVRNSLSVRIRDIAKVGEVLDRAVTLGINQGGEISYDIDDPKPLHAAARRAAVEDATATARALAEAAGVTLGPVRAITDESGSAPPVPMLQRGAKMMAMEAAAPAVPVEAGETSVQANVRMEFEIAR